MPTLARRIRDAEEKLGPLKTYVLRQFRQAHHNPEAQPDPALVAQALDIIACEPQTAQVILEGPK